MAKDEREQAGQGGKSAGGDDIRHQGRQEGGVFRVDGSGGAKETGRLAQEGSLALVAFDEVSLAVGQEGEDEARKPCPAAEVGKSTCRRRQEIGQLGAVEDVAVPELVEVAGGDEVDAAAPAADKVGIGLEATALVGGKREQRAVVAIRFHVKQTRAAAGLSRVAFHVKQAFVEVAQVAERLIYQCRHRRRTT